MAHGFLASSLRRSDRPADVLGCIREAVAIYESIRSPTPGDLYNMARAYAQVADLDEGDRGAETSGHLKAKAVSSLRRALEVDRHTVLPLPTVTAVGNANGGG